MSERMEPAFTPEQWHAVLHRPPGTAAIAWNTPVRRLAAANAEIPDTDPRKLTRAQVNVLREVAKTLAARPETATAAAQVGRIADVLDLVLPPD